MELLSSSLDGFPRTLARGDFSNTVSTLFGLEASQENIRRDRRIRLPAPYKTALAAEAYLFKPRFPRRALHRCRKPAPPRAQVPPPVGETNEAYPPWTELVSCYRTNLEQTGFLYTNEYRANFGRNGMVVRAKEQLIASRFHPRKALAQ